MTAFLRQIWHRMLGHCCNTSHYITLHHTKPWDLGVLEFMGQQECCQLVTFHVKCKLAFITPINAVLLPGCVHVTNKKLRCSSNQNSVNLLFNFKLISAPELSQICFCRTLLRFGAYYFEISIRSQLAHRDLSYSSPCSEPVPTRCSKRGLRERGRYRSGSSLTACLLCQTDTFSAPAAPDSHRRAAISHHASGSANYANNRLLSLFLTSAVQGKKAGWTRSFFTRVQLFQANI